LFVRQQVRRSSLDDAVVRSSQLLSGPSEISVRLTSPGEARPLPKVPSSSSERHEEVVSQRLSIIEGPYVRDILDQPRALEATHRRLRSSAPLDTLAQQVRGGRYQRLVLTGMGSSCHGLHPLHLRLVEAGVPAIMVDSSELLHYQSRLLDERTLLILVSQSGRSAEILRLLEKTKGQLETIAVTNSPDGPLARDASAILLTHAGEEATVACKSHLATQMALAWLGTHILGGDRESARDRLAVTVPATRAYLEAWRSHVTELARLLEGVRVVYYVGRGPSLGAALSAGLITKESTHLPSEGLGSAAFRHGPMEMVDDTVFLLAFAGEERTRRLNESLVSDVRAAGGRAFLAAEDADETALRLPPVGDLARPVVELLPVEMITLALAALAGREAGTFRVGQKVTTTE
jgi:glucosamine--fructose-6-phosphate aminotransferase (isomerizing)